MRIDLVGTTADFRGFGPPPSLPINHLLCENPQTAGRIGEDGLGSFPADLTPDRPAPGEPPAPVPQPLFPLFYQVEIRHRQPSNDNPPPARGADARIDIVRLWQFNGCRHRNSGPSVESRPLPG